MKNICLTAVLLAFIGSLGQAQKSSAAVLIGGANSCSSEGFNDPGLLNDGLTAASGILTLDLDVGASTLTATVTNTSPVLVGVNNPLITDVYFNTPSAVTGMSLTGQTSSAGVNPSFTLSFDADLGTGPNPNGADGFGAYSVELADTGNIGGTLANPDADTYVMPAANLAVSPCTFSFDLTGTLTGLTAADFLSTLSVGGGTKNAPATFKYQAGGVAEASAFITDGGNCPNPASSVQLGDPCPALLTITPPIQGGTSTALYDGDLAGQVAFFLYSQPGTPFVFQGCEIFLSPPFFIGATVLLDGEGNTEVTVSNGDHPCGQETVVQAFVLSMSGIAEASNGVLLTFGD